MPTDTAKTRADVHYAFSEMYNPHADQLPLEAAHGEYHRRIRRCYPSHPELFARLFDNWSRSTSLSLNPPTGLWDRRLGPGGRWAGACMRAGAFWGVQGLECGAGAVGGAWGSAALRRALWAAQMSWGRLRIRCRCSDSGIVSGFRWLIAPQWAGVFMAGWVCCCDGRRCG